jgi:hypothetical protein
LDSERFALDARHATVVTSSMAAVFATLSNSATVALL